MLGVVVQTNVVMLVPMESAIDWVNANKDWIALVLSVGAIVVGAWTVWISRKQARLDTYTRMHESLVVPDMAQGRRMLFLAHRQHDLPDPGDPDDEHQRWDKINQSLAMYDTLGLYYKRKLVPRKLLLDAWHHPLKAIRGPALAFMAHRRSHDIKQPWPMLELLLDVAAKHPCDCAFCQDFRGRTAA